MELKKSPKANIQNKRALFLEIGLALSLLLVIAFFSWSQKEKVVQKIEEAAAPIEEEITEITRQEQKPPEPVKQTIQAVADMLNVVKNDTKIETEFDFSDEFDEEAVFVQAAPVEEEKVEDDAPFYSVEEPPTFQGGDLNTFRTWVQKQLNYPTIAAENNISGKVTLKFVVNREGKIEGIQVLASPDRSLTEEAVRVLNASPAWKPGKQQNRTVKVYFTLPVEFRLDN